jgi:hypothetical protein
VNLVECVEIVAGQEGEQEQLREVVERFKDVFPKDLPDGLPPRRFIEHKIDLVEGAVPPSRRPYRLSPAEMQEVRRQLDDLLRKGFIRPSRSPFNAPCFLIKKADGSFRMVCDWRALIDSTISHTSD